MILNFDMVKAGVFVDPARTEIMKFDAWNWMNLRRMFPTSSHREVEDVVFRFAPLDCAQNFKSVMDGQDTVSYWTWYSHDAVRNLVLDVFAGMLPPKTEFGRILATRLKPGDKVYLHADEGAYAENFDRYHIVLQADAFGCQFHCGSEVVHMLTGEVWKFNHQLPHRVLNNGKLDRINLIVDVKR
jgi:hypothetical protein